MCQKKEPVQCRCPSCAVALVESLEFSAPAARSERSIPLFKTFKDYTVEGHTLVKDSMRARERYANVLISKEAIGFEKLENREQIATRIFMQYCR